MAFAAGLDQRRIAILVRTLDLGTAVEQKLHHFDMPVLARPHHRRMAMPVFGLEIGAHCDPVLDLGKIAFLARQHQWRPAFTISLHDQPQRPSGR